MPKSKILVGDVLGRLRELPDESVHCVVTSPPYFGLRAYGIPESEWAATSYPTLGGTVVVDPMTCVLGAELNIQAFIGHLIVIFREIRRVLRADGTAWCNLGDSYANDGKWGGETGGKQHYMGAENRSRIGREKKVTGLKPKDLMGVPWAFAFAARADGWWLRQDVVWEKLNPMPHPVRDRCVTAHEYMFLLAKQPRYFFDHEAIKEDAVSDHPSGNRFNGRQGGAEQFPMGGGAGTSEEWRPGGKRGKRSVWDMASEPFGGDHFATFPTKLVEPAILAGTSAHGCCANCGTQWERVVEPSERYARALGKSYHDHENDLERGMQAMRGDNGQNNARDNFGCTTAEYVTTGWRPTCHCDLATEFKPGDFDLIASPTGDGGGEDPSLAVGRAGMERPRGENEGSRIITRYQQRAYAAQLRSSPHRTEMREQAGHTTFAHYLRSDKTGARPIPEGLLGRWIESGWLTLVEMPERKPYPVVPATVLDPFSGAGTTAMVASRLGRDAIGVELNPDYAELSRKRIANDNPLFNSVEVSSAALVRSEQPDLPATLPLNGIVDTAT